MPIPLKPESKRNTYNSSGYVVRVAEPALMQLCLAAMEAYVVGNPEAFEIETFGLLWGTARVHRASKKTFFSVEHASTHLSAKGDHDSVRPDMNAIRLRRMPQRRLFEVAVLGFRTSIVGVVRHADLFEGRHERHALGHIDGPLVLRQILHASSGDCLLSGIIAPLGNSFEPEASAVEARRLADPAVPAGVVPRHADRDVTKRITH
jgi:hypothetical protein